MAERIFIFMMTLLLCMALVAGRGLTDGPFIYLNSFVKTVHASALFLLSFCIYYFVGIVCDSAG